MLNFCNLFPKNIFALQMSVTVAWFTEANKGDLKLSHTSKGSDPVKLSIGK